MANRPMVFEILGDASNVTEVLNTFEEHAGKVAAAAATAFAGAKIGAALGANLEAEDSFARLEAQLGGVSAMSETASASAGALFAGNFGESMDESAAAVRSVGEQMVDLGTISEEELTKITGGAMGVADAFDKDLGEVTRAAGQLMKNGLAPDAETALDIITTGFTQGLDASGDFLDVLGEYADPMHQLGLDGETAIGMFKAGLDSGAISLDKVGDSLNEFATLATESGGSASEAFTTLGFDADDMAAKIAAGGPGAKEAFSQTIQALAGVSDAVVQNEAGVQLFGSMWEDAGKGMVLSLDPATAAMTDVAGATTELGDTLYGTATNKVAGWRRSMESAIASAVGLPGPVGIGAAAVGEFGGDAMALTSTLGLTMVALRGMSLGTIASSIATKAAAVGSGIATAAQWAWNAALSANPIALVVLAIAALVAGFVWAWQNVDGFKVAMLGAWEWIKGAWSSAAGFFSGVGGAISGAFSSTMTWLSENWPLILGIITGPIGWAVLAVTSNWDSITGFFSAGVEKVKGFLSLLGSAMYTVFSWTPLGLITTNFGSIVGFFQGLPAAFSTALSGLGSTLTAAFKGPFNAVAGLWNRSVGSLSFSAPSWVPGVGGKGFSMPKIPLLAEGGIATRATLAMIGEGRGPEAIVPLDKIGEFIGNVKGQGASSNGGRPTYHIENLNTGANARDIVDELDWLERTKAL